MLLWASSLKLYQNKVMINVWWPTRPTSGNALNPLCCHLISNVFLLLQLWSRKKSNVHLLRACLNYCVTIVTNCRFFILMFIQFKAQELILVKGYCKILWSEGIRTIYQNTEISMLILKRFHTVRHQIQKYIYIIQYAH